jgi:predicted acylesterase/phospholipase RssA
MTRPINHTQAVILSGGGAYGAYEIGVMKALFTGESPSTGHAYLNPGIFTGTSVGAYNAAFMVSRPDEDICATIRSLESVWLNHIAESSESCGNGVFRIRANPLRYANPACFANPAQPFSELADDGAFFARNLFSRTVNFLMSAGSLSDRALELVDVSAFLSSSPLRSLIRQLVTMEGIRRGDRILRLVATNWETGELRTFENRDMTDEQGHDIIIGSAAIPGIFHPHEIAGQPYVDGGLVMNTPLSCAIEAGATTVHVIYMDPDVKNIPLRTLESSIDALDRVLLITSASKVGEDIETAAWINEGLEVIERTAGGDSLSNADLRAFVRVANQIYQKIKAGAPYKKVTIHRYHPQDDLGGGTLGLLNFDKDRMVAVIKRGFDDALNHDCDASHCILPKET